MFFGANNRNGLWVNPLDKEIIEDGAIPGIGKMVRPRLEIVARTLSGSWSETAQEPWMPGSTAAERCFWLAALGPCLTWGTGREGAEKLALPAFILRSKACHPPRGELLSHRKEGPVIRKPPEW